MSVATLLASYLSRTSEYNFLSLEQIRLSGKVDIIQKQISTENKKVETYDKKVADFLDSSKAIAGGGFNIAKDDTTGRTETNAKIYAENMTGIDMDQVEYVLTELTELDSDMEAMVAGLDVQMKRIEAEMDATKEALGNEAGKNPAIGSGGGG